MNGVRKSARRSMPVKPAAVTEIINALAAVITTGGGTSMFQLSRNISWVARPKVLQITPNQPTRERATTRLAILAPVGPKANSVNR